MAYVVGPRNLRQGLARPRRAKASACRCFVSAGFRPNFTPRTCAGTLPSAVLAKIKCRSNSARPPRTVSISLPCGEVPSAQGSPREQKPALASSMAARVLSRSRVERASRSSLVTSSTSPGARQRRHRASAARSVLIPDCFSANIKAALKQATATCRRAREVQ